MRTAAHRGRHASLIRRIRRGATATGLPGHRPGSYIRHDFEDLQMRIIFGTIQAFNGDGQGYFWLRRQGAASEVE